MRKLFLFVAACMLVVGAAYAQDPGIQDSIIVDAVRVDSGVGSVSVSLWVVTDDSVATYNIPLEWNAPLGGVHAANVFQYFYPLTSWDEHYDTLKLNEGYMLMLGWKDVIIDSTPNPPLHTNGQRLLAMTLRYVIDPPYRSQLVELDTTHDSRAGAMYFGLTDGLTQISPGFQHGFIAIGPNTGVDEDASLPTEFKLAQNYPNPFNPETNIEFSLPKALDVTVLIYNLLGQQVRTLVSGRVEAGVHAVRWDGRNDTGADAPSGVYFYRLYTSEFSQTNKMVLVR